MITSWRGGGGDLSSNPALTRCPLIPPAIPLGQSSISGFMEVCPTASRANSCAHLHAVTVFCRVVCGLSIRCVQSNIVLLTQAFRKKFVIPDFQAFTSHIDDLYQSSRALSGGQVCLQTHHPPTLTSILILLFYLFPS